MFLSRIRANKFLSSVLLLAGGSAIAQGITVGVTPILTRIYTPEDFGMLAGFVSALSIFMVMGSLRFEFALPQIQNRRTAQALAYLSLLLVFLVGVLAFCSLLLLHLVLDKESRVWEIIWLLPLGLTFAGAFQVANYWAIREKDFKGLAKANINRSFLQAFMQVVLGIAGMGAIALAVGYVVGQAIGAYKLLVRALPASKRISPWRHRVIACSYRRFPILSVPAGLLNISAVHLTPFLLLYTYGAATAGFFSLAQRAMGAPMAFLGMAIANVFLSELPRIKEKEPEQLMGFYLVACRNLFIVGLPIVAGATFLLWYGVEIIFGEEWSEAAFFSLYLAPFFLGQFVVAPLSQTLTVLGRQDAQLLWDFIRLVLPNSLFFLIYMIGGGVTEAVFLYGLMMAVVYILNIFLTVICLRKWRRDLV